MFFHKPYFLKQAMLSLERADPGFYCLALSFQATFAGLMGAAYWLFFRPPNAFMILLVPPLMVIMIHQLRIRKNWLWWLFLSAMNIAAGAFVFSALHLDRVLILLFLFAYTYLNFFSFAYRSVGSTVVLLGSMSTTLPGGWHHGVNHAIMVGISLAVALMSCLAFNQVYRTSIRSVLQLLMKQVINAFSQMIDPDPRHPGIRNTEKEVAGRYSVVALKADFLIRKAVFYLPSTHHYQQKAIRVLISLRRLMADRELIRGIRSESERLIAVLPGTLKIIESVHDRLHRSRSALLDRSTTAPCEDKAVYQDWIREKRRFHPPATPEGLTISRIIYGLTCILTDLDRLEQAVVEFDQPISNQPANAMDEPGIQGPRDCPSDIGQQVYDRSEDRRGGQSTPMPAGSPNDLPAEAQMGIYQNAFKAAVATTLAMFLWKATHLPHGYWLLMTTSILLSGGNQGHILQRAGHRLIGTTVGIVLAYLFVVDFLTYNIYWAATLPAIFFLMLYLYFLIGNYGVMVIFVSIYVGVLLSTFAGSEELVDFFVFGTLFNRFVCTLLAGLLVVFCEIVIFPNANRSADMMERTLASFFRDLAYCVRILIGRYVQGEELSDSEWVLLNGIVEKYASTEQLNSWMHYEINLDEHYNDLYAASKNEIEALFAAIRPLIAMSCHRSTVWLSEDQRQSLKIAGEILSKALKDVENMFSDPTVGKPATLCRQIRRVMDTELETRFFVHELLKLAEALEQLMCCAAPEQRPAPFVRAEVKATADQP